MIAYTFLSIFIPGCSIPNISAINNSQIYAFSLCFQDSELIGRLFTDGNITQNLTEIAIIIPLLDYPISLDDILL